MPRTVPRVIEPDRGPRALMQPESGGAENGGLTSSADGGNMPWRLTTFRLAFIRIRCTHHDASGTFDLP